jgi:hypothetical protein
MEEGPRLGGDDSSPALLVYAVPSGELRGQTGQVGALAQVLLQKSITKRETSMLHCEVAGEDMPARPGDLSNLTICIEERTLYLP